MSIIVSANDKIKNPKELIKSYNKTGVISNCSLNQNKEPVQFFNEHVSVIFDNLNSLFQHENYIMNNIVKIIHEIEAEINTNLNTTFRVHDGILTKLDGSCIIHWKYEKDKLILTI